MASLTTKDKNFLEKLLQMSGGYVLDFSDRTMGEFFRDNLNIEIYQEKYNYASGSKANYMRGFWREASDDLVSKAILELIDYIQSKIMLDEFKEEDFKPILVDECKKIATRLVSGNTSGEPVSNAQMNAFLKQNLANVNLAIQNLETDMQLVIKQRIDEISVILVKAPLAATFLIGSTLEGVLLELAKDNQTLFKEASASPKNKKGVVKPFDDWRLSDLINVAHETGYVSKNVTDFSHSLRAFRNYIHPRAQAKAKFNPNSDTAKLCLQVLKVAMTEITASNQEAPGSIQKQALSLSQEILEFITQRGKGTPGWPRSGGEYPKEMMDYINETAGIYDLRYLNRTLDLYDTFAEAGINMDDDRFTFEHPTNTLGMRSVAIKLASWSRKG